MDAAGPLVRRDDGRVVVGFQVSVGQCGSLPLPCFSLSETFGLDTYPHAWYCALTFFRL